MVDIQSDRKLINQATNMSGKSPPTPRPADAGSEVLYRKHPRARYYRLRVEVNGTAVVTIPKGGSRAEASRFLEKHRDWVEGEQARRRSEGHRHCWRPGTRILFRGVWVVLTMERSFGRPVVRFADQGVPVADPAMDFRRPVCDHLRRMAAVELPQRLEAIAGILGIAHGRTLVRDQATRWGSCSETGTISLNWRLVQAPQEVADYVILHELTHRIELNHSRRFWRRVEKACPCFEAHETWLTDHAGVLGL